MAINAPPIEVQQLLNLVQSSLDDDKGLEIVTIDLAGKTSIADYMVVATGTSQRHVGAMAEKLADRMIEAGHQKPGIEGLAECSWVLIDAGDILVHLFRTETRAIYDIERLWSVAPSQRLHAVGDA